VSAKKKSGSDLVVAAETLDAELRQFDDEVATFTRLALSSKKGLERGRELLEALAAAEDRASQQVQALVQAVASTSQKQGARIDAVRAKAEELARRTGEYEALISQFEALGAGASALNAKLQGEPVAVELDAEIGALVSKSEALVAQARAQNFDDVVHLADALRQQVTAIRGKLQQVQGPTV
jgi:hypothetical protein